MGSLKICVGSPQYNQKMTSKKGSPVCWKSRPRHARHRRSNTHPIDLASTFQAAPAYEGFVYLPSYLPGFTQNSLVTHPEHSHGHDLNQRIDSLPALSEDDLICPMPDLWKEDAYQVFTYSNTSPYSIWQCLYTCHCRDSLLVL